MRGAKSSSHGSTLLAWLVVLQGCGTAGLLWPCMPAVVPAAASPWAPCASVRPALDAAMVRAASRARRRHGASCPASCPTPARGAVLLRMSPDGQIDPADARSGGSMRDGGGGDADMSPRKGGASEPAKSAPLPSNPLMRRAMQIQQQRANATSEARTSQDLEQSTQSAARQQEASSSAASPVWSAAPERGKTSASEYTEQDRAVEADTRNEADSIKNRSGRNPPSAGDRGQESDQDQMKIFESLAVDEEPAQSSTLRAASESLRTSSPLEEIKRDIPQWVKVIPTSSKNQQQRLRSRNYDSDNEDEDEDEDDDEEGDGLPDFEDVMEELALLKAIPPLTKPEPSTLPRTCLLNATAVSPRAAADMRTDGDPSSRALAQCHSRVTSCRG